MCTLERLNKAKWVTIVNWKLTREPFSTAATLGGRGRRYSFPQIHPHVRTIDEWKVESTLPFWKDVKINFLLQANVIEVWFTRTLCSQWTHVNWLQLVNYLSCIHRASLQRTHLIHDIWDQCSLHQTSTVSGANDGGTYSVTIWIQGEMQRAMHLKNEWNIRKILNLLSLLRHKRHLLGKKSEFAVISLLDYGTPSQELDYC